MYTHPDHETVTARALLPERGDVRVCDYCGGEFVRPPRQVTRRYCSQACNDADGVPDRRPRPASAVRHNGAGTVIILGGVDWVPGVRLLRGDFWRSLADGHMDGAIVEIDGARYVVRGTVRESADL